MSEKPGLKAIETAYKGYLFRSRLEARWAVFLDTLGVPYQYEPEGFDLDGLWYLPDFWLPDQQCWMEIKGKQACGYFWLAGERRYTTDPKEIAADTIADPDHIRAWLSRPVKHPPDADQLQSLTAAHRLAEASGFPVFMVFSDLCPLTISEKDPVWDEEIENWLYTPVITGSNQAWYPDGKHDDGCVEWSQCPKCGLLGIASHGQHDRCACQCLGPTTRLRAVKVSGGGHHQFSICAVCEKVLDSKSIPFPHETWKQGNPDLLLKAYQTAKSARFERRGHQ